MHIVLSGQTPAQKNSKNVGRNKYTGKTFFTSSTTVKEWQKDVAKQLMPYKQRGFSTDVSIVYKFYCKDNRRRDLDNMVASVNDALKLAGIIVDDSWQWLTIGGAEGEIDKANPRAEIWIDD